jgi:hypothetical protein
MNDTRQSTSGPVITPEREAELQRLKAYFPARIVYAADKPDGSDWQCSAVLTRRIPNKLMRQGYRVAVLS